VADPAAWGMLLRCAGWRVGGCRVVATHTDGHVGRLVCYFRGQHTLDEIQWRENLPAAVVQDTLQRFASVLHPVVLL
jgi:hypothetical protein